MSGAHAKLASLRPADGICVPILSTLAQVAGLWIAPSAVLVALADEGNAAPAVARPDTTSVELAVSADLTLH
ncbi:hypothetical protein [Streptomyces sp. NPDC059881]|uniref:hypothetical protein n=1 Tax=Streptomyces sp. NPDC059881 TaxID=3346986 RepID=UPI00366885F0